MELVKDDLALTSDSLLRDSLERGGRDKKEPRKDAGLDDELEDGYIETQWGGKEGRAKGNENRSERVLSESGGFDQLTVEKIDWKEAAWVLTIKMDTGFPWKSQKIHAHKSFK